MNKEEFANFISEGNNVTKSEALRIITIFTESVEKALAQKDRVAILGFGTFDVTHSKERMGRNPSTGESIKIAASNRPAFKAGKKLKDAVN